MAPSATQSVGANAEQLALRFLVSNGLRFVRRNFNCRFGEIDLIMLDNGCLVFVEVRYRARNRISGAALSVNAAKQQKIIRAASMFLSWSKRFSDTTTRFDVVAIDRTTDGEYRLQWLQDAFRPGY